jgi:tRNA threonylcarbamoyladenosine biosynthesis protein TsaE
MEFLSKSTEETIQFASNFAKDFVLSKGMARVVGLYGELGTGKTTFMKGVAKYFNIEETIQSPTFVIEKIYELPATSDLRLGANFSHLIHIDAYRIEKSEELVNLGWREIISDKGNLICIEWPEHIADIMPEHIKIEFKHINKNERRISIK